MVCSLVALYDTDKKVMVAYVVLIIGIYKCLLPSTKISCTAVLLFFPNLDVML